MALSFLPPTLIIDLPPLFLGPRPDLLPARPEMAIISLCHTPVDYPTQISMPFRDVLSARELPLRDHVETFLDHAHKLASVGPTYWHCHRGMNRSGFAVAAYLHLHHGMRISEAIDVLRTLRSPLVLQNPTFERALRLWYGRPDEQHFEPLDLAKLLAAQGIEVPPQHLAEALPMPEADDDDDAVELFIGDEC